MERREELSLRPLDIQQFRRGGKWITVAVFLAPPNSEESYIVKNQKTGRVVKDIPMTVRAKIETNLFGNPFPDVVRRLGQRDFIAQQRSRLKARSR